jgi:hypothetical protein
MLHATTHMNVAKERPSHRDKNAEHIDSWVCPRDKKNLSVHVHLPKDCCTWSNSGHIWHGTAAIRLLAKNGRELVQMLKTANLRGLAATINAAIK